MHLIVLSIGAGHKKNSVFPNLQSYETCTVGKSVQLKDMACFLWKVLLELPQNFLNRFLHKFPEDHKLGNPLVRGIHMYMLISIYLSSGDHGYFYSWSSLSHQHYITH